MAYLQRTGSIAQVLMRHGALALVDQIGLAQGSAGTRLGRRLARTFKDLGPTFVKLGQILATREDMLPATAARELATLQDDAGEVSRGQIRRALEQGLGAPIEKRFASFDDKPLAAGSIAQVHRARTFAGDEVVVKIRRPGIETIIEADLALLEGAAQWLSQRSEPLRRHDIVGFAREFGTSLRAELDFNAEAATIGRMRRLLRGTTRVPTVYPELSGSSVLTLEFIEGVKVSQTVDSEARRDAARQVVAAFATQYLRGALFHADPHAGNLVRCPDGKLSMFDLGAVGHMDAGTRRVLLRLALSAVRRSADGMALAMLDMVHVPQDLDRDGCLADLRALLEPVVSKPLAEVNFGLVLAQALTIARRHGLRVRTEYFTLLRSCMLVDGVLRGLDPSLDPVEATRQHILRSWYRPTWFAPALVLVGLSALQHTRAWPLQVRQSLARMLRRRLP